MFGAKSTDLREGLYSSGDVIDLIGQLNTSLSVLCIVFLGTVFLLSPKDL
jgi:hypothetical protein